MSTQEAEGKKGQIETFKIQENIIYTAKGGHQSATQLIQIAASMALLIRLKIRELQEEEDVFKIRVF